VLQLHTQYSNVPRKLVVAKRLAQCLNPALPAGVHQKALEVYGVIFDSAGAAQLAEDLPLWSYGLFPFLHNASMSVKPLLLALYKKYYLPLGARLRPSLKGLVIALLPGLEEEHSEFFDPVLAMLDQLSDRIGSAAFFQSLALSLVAAPSLRGAAVNYLIRRVAKFSKPEDAVSQFGSDLRLLAIGVAATLEDDRMLVQRGALELLVSSFPFESKIFSEAELDVIVKAAVHV
ncbi:hypothetical protein HK405_000303, partial [Cladochytrium tenue]